MGDDKGSASLTGTCVIRLPRRVCIVVTSKMSGFGSVSLILGIEVCDYEDDKSGMRG